MKLQYLGHVVMTDIPKSYTVYRFNLAKSFMRSLKSITTRVSDIGYCKKNLLMHNR